MSQADAVSLKISSQSISGRTLASKDFDPESMEDGISIRKFSLGQDNASKILCIRLGGKLSNSSQSRIDSYPALHAVAINFEKASFEQIILNGAFESARIDRAVGGSTGRSTELLEPIMQISAFPRRIHRRQGRVSLHFLFIFLHSKQAVEILDFMTNVLATLSRLAIYLYKNYKKTNTSSVICKIIKTLSNLLSFTL